MRGRTREAVYIGKGRHYLANYKIFRGRLKQLFYLNWTASWWHVIEQLVQSFFCSTYTPSRPIQIIGTPKMHGRSFHNFSISDIRYVVVGWDRRFHISVSSSMHCQYPIMEQSSKKKKERKKTKKTLFFKC